MVGDKQEKARLVRMLSAVPIFSGLEKRALEEIAALGREVTFETDKTILKEGEKGLAFLVIIEGKVEVRKRGKPVATIGQGGFFGEMTVIDDRPRSADVVALQPTKCFGVTAWAFRPLLTSNPDLAIGIIKELVRRLRQLEESPTS